MMEDEDQDTYDTDALDTFRNLIYGVRQIVLAHLAKDETMLAIGDEEDDPGESAAGWATST